jgi:hypothetical protein
MASIALASECADELIAGARARTGAAGVPHSTVPVTHTQFIANWICAFGHQERHHVINQQQQQQQRRSLLFCIESGRLVRSSDTTVATIIGFYQQRPRRRQLRNSSIRFHDSRRFQQPNAPWTQAGRHGPWVACGVRVATLALAFLVERCDSRQ